MTQTTQTPASFVITALIILACVCGHTFAQDTVAAFLTRYDTESRLAKYTENEAAWSKDTDITDAHDHAYVNASLEFSRFAKQMAQQANSFLKGNNPTLTSDQRRQLNMIQRIGTAAQTDETKIARLTKVISEMESIYATAKVCLDGGKTCMNLEPGLTDVMGSSRDCGRLSEAWKGWRDATGRKMKDLYTEYVQLSNDAVKVMGFNDLGDYWKSEYDTSTFEDDLAALLDQMKPLYQHLHAYVRRKLRQKFGSGIFPASGHIPAHILGNMWSQEWGNVGENVTPFKGKPSVDVTNEMIKQGYTVNKMFRTAESFFYSLGFDNMTQPFWQNSMFVRPEGREVVCHASAWDMDKDDDFRIKMCTTITHSDLMTIHHEMGHIQYYMQYKGQPSVYRTGANPGFHEAVGDTISLSVQTPEHLHAIGLLPNMDDTDTQADINFLMQMALDKVAFLPFGYLIDQWRWSVFRGDTPPERYNTEWWKLRCRLQGISPPVSRGTDDFDPGAKYHIPADVAYIRYFVSFVIQFQFYRAACEEAGNTRPLHRCDIFNNEQAGRKIRSMLSLGASKPWPEAMEEITGQRKMDAGALMEYFEPLLEFLKKQNGDDFGWQEECPDVIPPCTDEGQRLYPLQSLVVLVIVLFTFVIRR